MIQIRISDPRSLRSWRIKGTEESLPRVDSSVPLMHHDLSDLGSLILIWIIPKERTLRLLRAIVYARRSTYPCFCSQGCVSLYSFGMGVCGLSRVPLPVPDIKYLTLFMYSKWSVRPVSLQTEQSSFRTGGPLGNTTDFRNVELALQLRTCWSLMNDDVITIVANGASNLQITKK